MDKWRLLASISRAGFTQRSLAKAIGVSRNTLNSKVNGHGHFDTEEIRQICDLLRISSSQEKADIFLSVPSQK